MQRDWCEADADTLGLEGLVEALGVDTSVVVEYEQLGLFGTSRRGASPWRFSAPDVERLSRALRLSRDLELHAAAAALLVELLEERARLRRRVACLEQLAGRGG
jgi:DNA-binding transcriptional MerR regulator